MGARAVLLSILLAMLVLLLPRIARRFFSIRGRGVGGAVPIDSGPCGGGS
jgi:hypothetical protein